MKKLTILNLLTLLITASIAVACTGVRTTSVDGDQFRGRTMEFGAHLPTDAIAVPAGYSYTGSTPDGSPGKKWESKYAIAGANAIGLPHIIDGINEKGLTLGLFYFSGLVGYEKPANYDDALAPWEFGTWILGNFSTVEEVRENLDEVDVCAVPQKDFTKIVDSEGEYIPPAHYLVMDKSGKSIVIEHLDGEVVVYDNPIGIITNDPTFDWHLANLDNYVNLSPVNAKPFKMEGLEISTSGYGSGLLGLPGDFTPPSRFIQSAFFSYATPPAKNNREGVLQTFRVLHQFDIPLGASRIRQEDPNAKPAYDTTLWTAVSDLTRCRYYFRTFKNSQIKMLDLKNLELDDEVISYPMDESEEEIMNITDELK